MVVGGDLITLTQAQTGRNQPPYYRPHFKGFRCTSLYNPGAGGGRREGRMLTCWGPRSPKLGPTPPRPDLEGDGLEPVVPDNVSEDLGRGQG